MSAFNGIGASWLEGSFFKEDTEVRKREKRIKTQLKRKGSKKFGSGWAARQASKRSK